MEFTRVFQAGRFSLMASGIVVGGVILGSALATFARPVPIEPQPAPWEGMLHPAVQIDEWQPFYNSPPEDLSPPDSYAPPIAFTTLKWWPEDLRLPRDAHYAPAQAVQPLPVPQYVPDELQVVERPMDIPHYAAIEQSVQQAQEAVQAAATAEQAPPPAPAEDTPDGGPKVIHVADQLAQAG